MRGPSALALLGALGACGGEPGREPLPFAPAGPQAAPDPAAPGPFPVGVRTLFLEDASRRKADGSPRRLITEVWYPAVQSARGQPGVRYDVRTLFTPAQRARLSGVEIPVQETRAVRDADPAASHGPFPLVIFSHGAASMRWQSTYFTVQLASHGYVVAAPDHEGGTLEDALYQTLVPQTDEFHHRPVDVSFLIDSLTALPPGDPLAGLVNAERVGVAGHSFGAYTTMRSAALDARIQAIVPQAPITVIVAWAGRTPPEIPVLIQAGHEDRILPWDDHVAPTWERLGSPSYLLDLKTGGHFTFSDLCAFDVASLAGKIELDVPGVDLNRALGDGCSPPAPPAEVAQPLINHFAVGFFNTFLRDSPRAEKALSQEAAEAIAPGVAAVLVRK